MKRVLVGLICVTIIIGSTAAWAAEVDEDSFFDNFDDGTLTEYVLSGVGAGGTHDELEPSTAESVSSPYSLHVDAEQDTSGNCVVMDARLDEQLSLSSTTNVSFEFKGDIDPDPGTSTRAYIMVILNDSTGDSIQLRLAEDTASAGVGGDPKLILSGSILTSTVKFDRLDYSTKFHTLTMVINRTALEVTVYRNGSVVGTGTMASDYSDPGNSTVRVRGVSDDDFGCADSLTPRAYGWIDDLRVEGFSLPDTRDIELEVTSAYMDHGAQQDYTVYRVDTNQDTGETTRTDISGHVNTTVTSADTDIATVDENLNQLHATSDESVNGQVVITANYTDTDGELHQDTATIVVANKSLDNLAILPPATWPSALFGSPGSTTGSSSTWPGAVQLQWLFVAFVIGALISHITNNSFIGVATVPMMLALGWAINWVSDAILVLSIAFLLWIAISRGFGEVDPRAFAGK